MAHPLANRLPAHGAALPQLLEKLLFGQPLALAAQQPGFGILVGGGALCAGQRLQPLGGKGQASAEIRGLKPGMRGQQLGFVASNSQSITCYTGMHRPRTAGCPSQMAG